jgi:hypothetical protein
MPGDFSQIGTYLLVALIVFAVYRRLRRSFGRQKLRPRLIALRIVLLAVLGAVLSPMALRSGAFAAAALTGLACGVLLAWWGATRTSFERVGTERFYVPHTYSGIAVSLLFIGRVAYRLLQTYEAPHGAQGLPAMASGFGAAGYVSSPLTLGLVFVLVGYYVCYLGWVLRKSKQLKSGEGMEHASPVGADSGAPS